MEWNCLPLVDIVILFCQAKDLKSKIQSASVNLNSQGTKKFVRIVGLILLRSEAHGTKRFVRVSECSNYRVFESTDVNCSTFLPNYAKLFLEPKFSSIFVITTNCSFYKIPKLYPNDPITTKLCHDDNFCPYHQFSCEF